MAALILGIVLFGSATAVACWIAGFSLLWIFIGYWIGGNLGLLSTAFVMAMRRS